MTTEPTGWLYQYLKACILASVRKYPNDRKKWLGSPGANRMKLWALVLQKEGIITGSLTALDFAGAPGLTMDLNKAFTGSIWPWEVDRVARQVLEHNPSLDGNPAQRRASEAIRRAPPDLDHYVEQAKVKELSRVQRPGQQETVRLTYVQKVI